MQSIILTILGAFVAALLILALTLIGPLIGAFAGAVFGFFFPETAIAVLTALGLQTIAFWQFGAALGFVGAFFRATFSVKQQ